MLVSMDMAEYLATVAMTYSVHPIEIRNAWSRIFALQSVKISYRSVKKQSGHIHTVCDYLCKNRTLHVRM